MTQDVATLSPATAPRRASFAQRWTGRLVVGYGVAVVAAISTMYAAGDLWWPGTLLLYSPRWVVALPLAPLALAAVCFNRRAGVGLMLIAFVLVWFGMGFEVRGMLADDSPHRDALTVMTCNCEGRLKDPAVLKRLIEDEKPDLVLLQEWHAEGAAAVFGPGWYEAKAVHCVVSRYPVKVIRTLDWKELHPSGAVALVEVQTPGGIVRVVNVHLPTMRNGMEAVIHKKWDGLKDLDALNADRNAASELARGLMAGPEMPTIVAGDFNLTRESRVFRRHWGDLTDAFDAAGFGFGYTKFTSWHGARIDHILYDDAWTCRRCRVGPDIGSDHRPVIARLVPAR